MRTNVIPAKEILEKIQKGEHVAYDGVLINGDLDLSKLHLPTQHVEPRILGLTELDLFNEAQLIVSPIQIINAKINGVLSFRNIISKKSIDFSGSKFIGDADFSGSQFLEVTEFSKSQFCGDANFSESRFSGEANFSGSRFSGDAVFIGSRFRGNADFRNTHFARDAVFGMSQFNGDANFSKSQFIGYADFIQSNFNGETRFSESKFSKVIDFFKSQFIGDTYFVGSQFNEDAYFRESQFSGLANFGESRFGRDVLFEGVNFKEIGQFYLIRAIFGRIYVKYMDIKYALSWDNEVYLSLIENYKRLGWFEDADDCYYNYRIQRRWRMKFALDKAGKPELRSDEIGTYIQLRFDEAEDVGIFARLRSFADWLLWVLYGYGTKPFRPLGWLMLLLLISYFFYFLSIFGNVGNSPWTAFNTSLTVLLSATTLIDDPNRPATWMLYWAFTIEKLLASLFLALFLVSIGRTIIR